MKFHEVVVSYTQKKFQTGEEGLLWGLVVGGYRIFFILFVRSSRGKIKTVNIFLRQYYFSCSGLIGDRTIL